MAEVLKFAVRPTAYDNDEVTWLEFRFKLENYLTLVNEKYVALLQDAESQPVANVPLATLTTGRSLRLVQRVPNRNGFEVWRQLGGGKGTKDSGSKIRNAASRVAAELGDNPTKFEEAWNAWETSGGRPRETGDVKAG